MSNFTICYDPRVLVTRLKSCQSFKIYLGPGPALKPEYRPQSHYSNGDIVVFSFSQDYDLLFIGKVKSQSILRGVKWYNVECIQRSQKHVADLKLDEQRQMVKFIQVTHKDIICELVPWE